MKSDFQGKWFNKWDNEKNPKLTGSFLSWCCAELDKREARDAQQVELRKKLRELIKLAMKEHEGFCNGSHTGSLTKEYGLLHRALLLLEEEAKTK